MLIAPNYIKKFNSYPLVWWVGVIVLFFLQKPVIAQCAFERLNTAKTVAAYNADKIIELHNKNIVYLNRGIYTQALLNDSDTYNGLMEVTDACGTLLKSWVLSFGAGQDAVYDALETADGNVLVLLYTEASNWRNLYNLALMKINPYTGQVYWKQAYPKSRLSVGYGLSYNPFKNTYVIAAHAEFARKAGEMYALTKGYLLEVDTTGAILHQQFYPPLTTDSITDKFDTYFVRAVAIDSLHTMVLGVYNNTPEADTIYFINIYDTSFKLVKQTFPFKGIYRTDDQRAGHMVGSNTIDNLHQIVLNVEATKIADFPEPRGNVVAVIDTNGQMIKHTLMQEGVNNIHLAYNVNYVSPTPDGGFLVPNGYIKLDSNLQVVSTAYPKDYDATKFNYAIQLQDGSYTGIGSVWMQNNNGDYFAAQYTHRTNTKGWYTGLPPQEVTNNVLEVYPNPTSGVVALRGHTPSNNKINVHNALGKLVYMQEQLFTNTIDLGHLANGIYWLSVELANGQVSTKKVVLAK
jgi:hypothetical protein